MAKQFVFVSGDIGGARAQLPVVKKLKELGHDVEVIADAAGKGCDVWSEAKVDHSKFFSTKKIKRLIIEDRLFFVGTCASASDIEIAFAEEVASYNKDAALSRRVSEELNLDPKYDKKFVTLVLGSDGFFNHGFKKWQEATPATWHYWFAINEGHAQAIRSLRPNLNPACVKVVGQPAFDVVLDLLPRKEEIRNQRRQELGLTNDDTLVVWWSAGMDRIIQEDVDMVEGVLDALSVRSNIVFLPRIHPKLDTIIKAGYVAELRNRLQAWCANRSIKILNADKMPGEELNLAADLILSVTSTEDIKNVLIGGPPVVHFVGPTVSDWFEKELLLKPPYLPDLFTEQALAVRSLVEVPRVMDEVLQPETKKRLLANWRPPTEKATDKVVNELLEIADS